MGTRYQPACSAARYSSNTSTPLGRRVATTSPGLRLSPRNPCTTWLVRPSSSLGAVLGAVGIDQGQLVRVLVGQRPKSEVAHGVLNPLRRVAANSCPIVTDAYRL